ncbi:MAG: hypothetical protein N2439_08750 [Anaerolineae bacterium]|nr:hypothetical protein [Anaerolineae bacterium]
MSDQQSKPMRFARILTAEAVAVGDRTLQPVVRATGWHTTVRGERWTGAAAWIHLMPLEIVVQEADGRQQRLAVADPAAMLWRPMGGALVALALVCGAIMAFAAMARARRK